MIGWTSFGTVTSARSPAHGRIRIASRKVMPAVASATSGAPSERKAIATTTKISATLAASMIGSALSISSYCASRAGAAPVTPTTDPRAPAERPVRVLVRVGRRRVERQRRREVQVRDRGRAALAGGDAAPRVQDRQRGLDVGRHAAAVGEDAARREQRAALRGGRQALRVALDDRGLGREREPEALRRGRGGLARGPVLGGEVLERRGRRRREIRERDRRPHDSGDPRQRDEVAEGDDDRGIAAGDEMPARVHGVPEGRRPRPRSGFPRPGAPTNAASTSGGPPTGRPQRYPVRTRNRSSSRRNPAETWPRATSPDTRWSPAARRPSMRSSAE